MRRIHLGLIFTLAFLFIHGVTYAQRPVKKRPVKTSTTHPSHYSGRDTLDRKGVVDAFPTNFAATTMKISYESKIGTNKGLKLIGSFGGADADPSSYNNGTGGTPNTFYQVASFSEIGFEAQLRFYVLKDRPALNGLYLAPYLWYKSMNYTPVITDPYNSKEIAGSATSVSDFSIGYIIGYQYIFSSGFTFDAFVGGGDNIISGNNTPGNPAAINQVYGYPKGIMIHTGIALGIAF